MKTRYSIPLMVLLCALATGAAACSSSGTSSSSSTPPATSAPATTPPSSASTSPSAPSGSAAKTIAANWTAFFNPKTSVAQRVSLLQDGPQFEAIIKAQAGSALASSTSAKVTKVALTSPTQATVTYTILLQGTPTLTNQAGAAVLEGGVWKVGAVSFCGLLKLEQTAGLPAVCSSAG